MATARLAREAELAAVLDLSRMLNPDDPPLSPADSPRDPEAEDVRELWAEMLADDSLDVVVVEHGGRLVASCVCSVTRNLTRGARPWAVVENVVAHEDDRGRGFGSQCVEHAVDLARERNCYKVMLLTGSDEEWKHEFYEGCGFDPGDKTGFVRYLDTQ